VARVDRQPSPAAVIAITPPRLTRQTEPTTKAMLLPSVSDRLRTHTLHHLVRSTQPLSASMVRFCPKMPSATEHFSRYSGGRTASSTATHSTRLACGMRVDVRSLHEEGCLTPSPHHPSFAGRALNKGSIEHTLQDPHTVAMYKAPSTTNTRQTRIRFIRIRCCFAMPPRSWLFI